jgi:NAD(P)-dependent dehydrogenase (short-subunit alcohol dehydrogenase family)
MAEVSGRLSGKVALVTGASQGLGEQLARELAGNGAAVALAARNGGRRETIQRTIEARGGRAVAVPTDLSSESDCKVPNERAHEALGPLDPSESASGRGMSSLFRTGGSMSSATATGQQRKGDR